MEHFFTAFATLLVVAGPWKAVISFAETTQEMSIPDRRRTGMLTVGIASVVSVVMLLFGWALVDLFKIDGSAFLIGAGLIVVVFAVRMVVEPDHHEPLGPESESPLRLAIYPLSIPLLITPPAIATLTALGVDVAVSGERFIVVAAALLVVMGINLVSFVVLARTEHHVPSPVWSVAGRILGVFLVAFGVTIILQGIRLEF